MSLQFTYYNLRKGGSQNTSFVRCRGNKFFGWSFNSPMTLFIVHVQCHRGGPNHNENPVFSLQRPSVFLALQNHGWHLRIFVVGAAHSTYHDILSRSISRVFLTICRTAMFWPMEINYISSLYDACWSQKCIWEPYWLTSKFTLEIS